MCHSGDKCIGWSVLFRDLSDLCGNLKVIKVLFKGPLGSGVVSDKLRAHSSLVHQFYLIVGSTESHKAALFCAIIFGESHNNGMPFSPFSQTVIYHTGE